MDVPSCRRYNHGITADTTVETNLKVETNILEAEKKTIEDSVRKTKIIPL